MHETPAKKERYTRSAISTTLFTSEFLILAALADGPAHGAEISRRIIEMTAGMGYLPQTRVYETIARCERAGIIEAMSVVGRSRVVALTPKGNRQLRQYSRQSEMMRVHMRGLF